MSRLTVKRKNQTILIWILLIRFFLFLTWLFQCIPTYIVCLNFCLYCLRNFNYSALIYSIPFYPKFNIQILCFFLCVCIIYKRVFVCVCVICVVPLYVHHTYIYKKIEFEFLFQPLENYFISNAAAQQFAYRYLILNLPFLFSIYITTREIELSESLYICSYSVAVPNVYTWCKAYIYMIWSRKGICVWKYTVH